MKKCYDYNTGQSKYEWHKDPQSGDHHHKNAPDGKEHIGPDNKIF